MIGAFTATCASASDHPDHSDWSGCLRRISIATEENENPHVAIFYSPRRGETIPPKFHLIPPKFYFVSTWRIFLFHVENRKSPREDWELYRLERRSHRSNRNNRSYRSNRRRVTTKRVSCIKARRVALCRGGPTCLPVLVGALYALWADTQVRPYTSYINTTISSIRCRNTSICVDAQDE